MYIYLYMSCCVADVGNVLALGQVRGSLLLREEEVFSQKPKPGFGVYKAHMPLRPAQPAFWRWRLRQAQNLVAAMHKDDVFPLYYRKEGQRCVHIHTYIFMCVYLYLCIYTFLCISMHTYMYICIYVLVIHICVYIYMQHIYIYTYICMCYICTYICACICVCIHKNVHVYA